MNPLQKAAVRRKALYFAMILALFTVSIFYRGLEAKAAGAKSYVWVPFGRDERPAGTAAPNAVARAGDWLARHTITSQARRAELRELEQGDPELAGEALRLGLVGSRGFVVAALWYDAIDKQKRNDFHSFDVRVRTVTALQPHFIAPWIFQSWNITYNVSVEMHALGDMYYYIARGIELLAEGERRNRRSPDMRYQIAFYYQNKFGVADQVQTLRCLYQLSCIPPAERNPDELLNRADGTVNPEAFRKFCGDHPHLVRRLRGGERRDKDKKLPGGEGLRVQDPADVVEFLRANRDVPTRYRTGTELADADKQFPVLPPRFNEGPNEFKPDQAAGDGFSGFLAARAWYTYACALVPPNPRDEAGRPVPAATPRAGEYDAMKYRVPRLPMLILFRQGPPRAQTYQAEMEQKDGWFDAAGWEADAGVDDAQAWFTEPLPGGGVRKQKVVLGAGKEWSRAEWEEAARMWDEHGGSYGLILDEDRRVQYARDAGTDRPGLPPDPSPEQLADPDFARRYRAATALFFYHQNRQVTNFPFYLASAEAEQKPETVEARKTLWRADQARRAGNKLEATGLYKDGLGKWKQVLLNNPAFHRAEQFDKVEEETYEYELEYLRLIAQDSQEVRDAARRNFEAAVQPVGALLPFVAAAPVIPVAARSEWNATAAEAFSPFAGLMPSTLPDDRRGTPWVRNGVKQTVLTRQGVAPKPAADAAPPPPTGGQ